MKKNLQTAFSSRQYMFAKDFEVYYYNDNRLSKVSDHAHNYFEFYFFIEGDVSIAIGDSQHSLKSGDIIVIPLRVYHHAVIHSEKQPYRRFVLWVSEVYWKHLLQISQDFAYLGSDGSTQPISESGQLH